MIVYRFTRVAQDKQPLNRLLSLLMLLCSISCIACIDAVCCFGCHAYIAWSVSMCVCVSILVLGMTMSCANAYAVRGNNCMVWTEKKTLIGSRYNTESPLEGVRSEDSQ